MIIGYCNFIRSNSGTPVLLFLILWILLDQILLKREKAFYLLILVSFISIPYFHEKSLEQRRDIFLTENQPSKYYYQPHPFTYDSTYLTHPNPSFPTWHLFYIGLGLLSNDYGITLSDNSAIDRALSINPNVVYLSEEYNQIMKREYFRIVKSDPWFVIKTYLHKLASIVVFVLLYANIGLVFSLYVRRSWRELIPLFITALYTAIPALVISPYERYSLGLISLSLIFAIYMVSLGIEKYMREAEITPQLQPM
ncbi:MAG: hypothetical protein K1060chlam2_00274 [Chlamydiae bacterium]|nr:hypothetical protein [Chlamydiota bacterium]